MAARQSGMRVNKIYGVPLMNPSNCMENTGEKTGARNWQTHAARKRKVVFPLCRRGGGARLYPAAIEGSNSKHAVGNFQSPHCAQRLGDETPLGIIVIRGVKRSKRKHVQPFAQCRRRLNEHGRRCAHAADESLLRNVSSRNISSHRRVIRSQSKRSACLRPARPSFFRRSGDRSSSCRREYSSWSELTRYPVSPSITVSGW